MSIVVYETSIGDLGIEVHDEALTAVYFPNDTLFAAPKGANGRNVRSSYTREMPDNIVTEGETETHKEAIAQIRAYLRGESQQFTVPLRLIGTDFQRKCWQALLDIPYGQTASYQDIAIAVGSPKAVRAVGGANAANPIPIIVPCHRVIGKNGKLTGFGGGLTLKEKLLGIESVVR